jgi:Chaperone of endosialidase
MKKPIIVAIATLAVVGTVSRQALAQFCGSNACGANETSVTTSAAPGLKVTTTGGNGISGNTDNSSSSGVIGANTNTSSGNGVYGESSGTGIGVNGSASGGIGVYGSDSNGGVGVRGVSNVGGGYGVYGSSSADNGIGVYGLASYDEVDSYANYGGYFLSDGPNGVGVYGEADDTGGYGVEGVSTNGFAGYFVGGVLITTNLFVDGDVTISGSCSGCSDLRMKKNVKPLTGALDQLLQLKEVTFEWIDPTKHHHERETGTQVGFVAQDIEKIHPQWVNPEGYKSKDGETFRTIDLHEIEALEVGSIRELKAENDALKNQSAKLQAQLDKQQAEIDEIKNGKDPISHGPGFGPGMLALLATLFAGGTGLAMKLALKRMGVSLATVVGLLLAGRKKDDEKRS